MMHLTINDTSLLKGDRSMEVRELKDALSAFNPAVTVSVAVPSVGKPHELRAIRVVGHLDHPGEIKNDPDHPGALDIVTDAWEGRMDPSTATTLGDLVAQIEPYPDAMHVRVAMPVAHDAISHRMLDIVMLGHATGAGAGVQIVCESWDNLHQVVREIPEVAAARLAAAPEAEPEEAQANG